MLNLNSLYNAVFTPEYKKFNPQTDYYTILIDTPAFQPLYQDLWSKLQSMMNREAYCYFHSEKDEDLSRKSTVERMSRVAESLESYIDVAPPSRKYCLLSYFDDEHRDVDSLLQLLPYLPRDGGDLVTIVVCLSSWMPDLNAFLKQLSEQLWNNAPYAQLYLFTDRDTPYYRRSLIQSLCGVILTDADYDSHQNSNAKKNVAYSKIEQYIEFGIDEEGRKQLLASSPVRWSTMYCKFYDRQSDFLNQYMAEAISGVKQLDYTEFSKVMDEVYKSIVPTKDENEVLKHLHSAVSFMPYVIQTPPRSFAGTMEDFFNMVYGTKGAATVDLTMKATLSGIYQYKMEDIVKKCCLRLFQLCSSFAVEDLHELICNHMEQYLTNLESGAAELKHNLKLVLDDDLNLEKYTFSMNKYFESYIRLYLNQKKNALWVEALRHIRIYEDEYREYCEKSLHYHRDMSDLGKTISTNNVYQFGELNVSALTAEEVLTMDQNPEWCAKIRELFAAGDSSKQVFAEPKNCEPVFQVPMAPNFYHDRGIRLETPSYTMCGCQYIGKYMVFIGGAQDD